MSEESVEALLKEILMGFLGNDDAIFTRLTDPFNVNWVVFIVRKVQYSNDLMEEQWVCTEKLIASFVDVFAELLEEILPVPGAKHSLNIPEGVTFHL